MSFCNNNIIDVATSDRGAIYLGVWDTLNVRQQQFDVSAWLDAYGDDGVLTILNQRRTDALPYEVADVTLENGIATWTFDETDTAIVGEGKAALVYIRAGETIARTAPIPTYTAPTIGMTGIEPPDPWEAWYTRILEASAAAQQAAAHAGVSASNAASAAESAYTQAQQAATARSQAVEARNEARAARDEAQAAQGLAETARDQAQLYAGDAQTAATAAAAAKTAAETAKSGAEIAEANAEDAESGAQAAENGAVSAQSAAEAAQAAAEAAAAQAEANKYAAFATDGASAITRFRAALGADAIPVKTALVKQTAGTVPLDWTLRRCGKNQFDASTVLWKKSYIISSTGEEASNSNYAYTLPLIPVIPGARYVASGFRDRETDVSLLLNTYCTVCFYDATGTFRARYGTYGPNANPYFTTPSIAAGDAYDCCFIRFYCTNDLIGDDNKVKSSVYASGAWHDVAIQFEILDNPSATAADATAFEPYAGVEYAVPITALNTPTAPTATVTTALGQNVFALIPASLPAVGSSFSATATMDLRARLDPTLVYDSLRGA